jgi:hypothetical protein
MSVGQLRSKQTTIIEPASNTLNTSSGSVAVFHIVLKVAQPGLRLACRLLNLAFKFQRLIAGHFSGDLFDFSFGFLDPPFNLIFIHSRLLKLNLKNMSPLRTIAAAIPYAAGRKYFLRITAGKKNFLAAVTGNVLTL